MVLGQLSRCLRPVMSEVSINVSHGTTFIYGTQAGPSNPVDLLGQWR